MERIKLHDLFKGVQTASSDMEEYLTEQRFSGGRVCPICGGTHVQRNGKRKNGAQKFICKDCGKTFSIRKNTIFNGTRKSLSVWREYMSCMAEGLTIDQSAERCGITHYIIIHMEAQDSRRPWRVFQRHRVVRHCRSRRDIHAVVIQGRQVSFLKGRSRAAGTSPRRREPQEVTIGRVGVYPMCHRPQGQCRKQSGQAREMLGQGREGGSWRPCEP